MQVHDPPRQLNCALLKNFTENHLLPSTEKYFWEHIEADMESFHFSGSWIRLSTRTGEKIEASRIPPSSPWLRCCRWFTFRCRRHYIK